MYELPNFSIGIEEEYLLVDLETRALANDPPDALFEKCPAALGDNVAHEFMRAQIEVNTPPCDSVKQAHRHLVALRRQISTVAAEYGLAPIAASTHPFSHWADQVRTDDERYNVIAEDLQTVVRRLLISSMHVHVDVGDDDLRIDLMNQAIYFLPHLLALSTSSPFWQGENTGLKSYRLSVWDEMPRTGIPDFFESDSEYRRHVQVLVNAGLIEDGSKLWWDIRPSARFPTLEMRICDVCTRVEDAIAITALFTCILRMLYRLKMNNQRWRQYASMLVNENRWRAQRYGTDAGLVDFGRGEIVAYSELLAEMTGLIAEDAEALGCTEEIAHLQTIVEHGTSAHRQIAAYEAAIEAGRSIDDALKAVVDLLVADTIGVG